jgi:hypothetical protein
MAISFKVNTKMENQMGLENIHGKTKYFIRANLLKGIDMVKVK